MALSGTFTGTTANQYITPKIVWSATQSLTDNTSTVTASLYYGKSSVSTSTTGGYWYGSITIDGTKQSFTGAVWTVLEPGGGDKLVATFSKTIDHNADGSRSVAISATGYIRGTTLTDTTLSGTITLDTIPRASSISCTTANIESKAAITINRASSSFTHTVVFNFGTLTGTIATKTSATSISWTIPSTFYAQIPDAKTGWGTLVCLTYSGSTQIGTSTCEFTVTTDEAKCKPTVSGTVVDTNTATVALTGDNNILVRYCSTALCTIAATLNKSAGSIKAKTINNVSVSGTTRSISGVETGVFDFYAKDSREYSNSDKVVKTLVEYVKLTNDAVAQRDDPTSGAATLTIAGNYFNGSFGATDNALTVKYRQGTGDYISVTPTISGNKYTATVPLSGLDYTQAFSYEVVVADKVSSISKKLTINKGIPVFDWGENDFAFNVPVKIDGTLTIGGQTITEAQLASLLALIS